MMMMLSMYIRSRAYRRCLQVRRGRHQLRAAAALRATFLWLCWMMLAK
jgi:hypothetical protein